MARGAGFRRRSVFHCARTAGNSRAGTPWRSQNALTLSGMLFTAGKGLPRFTLQSPVCRSARRLDADQHRNMLIRCEFKGSNDGAEQHSGSELVPRSGFRVRRSWSVHRPLEAPGQTEIQQDQGADDQGRQQHRAEFPEQFGRRRWRGRLPLGLAGLAWRRVVDGHGAALACGRSPAALAAITSRRPVQLCVRLHVRRACAGFDQVAPSAARPAASITAPPRPPAGLDGRSSPPRRPRPVAALAGCGGLDGPAASASAKGSNAPGLPAEVAVPTLGVGPAPTASLKPGGVVRRPVVGSPPPGSPRPPLPFCHALRGDGPAAPALPPPRPAPPRSTMPIASTRPAAGGGEARRRPAPRCVGSAHAPAPIFEHRGDKIGERNPNWPWEAAGGRQRARPLFRPL